MEKVIEKSAAKMDADSTSDDDRKPSAKGDDGRVSGDQTPNKNVKPALKKKAKSQEKQRHLQWDEAAIEEHDQLRGTRMKIDEPNTPYTQYDSGAESDDSRRCKSPAHQKDSISWDTLQTRLDSVAAVRDAYPSSPSVDTDYSDVEGGTGGDEPQTARDEMATLEFKEHRKRHYNEMELVKKFRQEHPNGVLDDDELQADHLSDDADDENE